MTGQKKKH